MSQQSSQRGIVLLVAIIMLAIATTIAAALTYSKAMAARRAAATFSMEQALQAGMAAEALAGIALQNDGNKSTTSLDQDWAQPLGPIEIEGTGVWIQAQLEDMSGRFNLNSLVKLNATRDAYVVDEDQVEIFRTLLKTLDLEERWADLMVDWIDTDIAPYGQGGEDTLYLTQVPAYRPPNTFITHTSELLALPGFGPERFTKLAPFVTALPNDTHLNICTASGQLLDVTKNDPSNAVEWAGQDLAKLRTKGCWPATQNDYLNGVSSQNDLRAKAQARTDVKSSWFRLRTNIRIGTAEFVLYSVLLREGGNRIRTFQRSFGSE